MKFEKTKIEGLLTIEPKVFKDKRGYFFESFNKKMFSENNIDVEFLQDNQSLSQKGVLRGLHFQEPPYAQAKLIKVITGKVFDVAVDLRKDSPTYGEHQTIILSAENNKMFFIPEGFAHGFLTLEDNTIFSYKCSNLYNTASENSILWNDIDLNINWNFENPILSEKDKGALSFNKFITPF